MWHCGWHRESNYRLLVKKNVHTQYSCCTNIWPISTMRDSNKCFACIKLDRRYSVLAHNKETSDFDFLRFQEKLKPKLIPHYPITSMKLNVDDSIKDNFLSFRFLRNLEQHVLKTFFVNILLSFKSAHFAFFTRRKKKKNIKHKAKNFSTVILCISVFFLW